MKRTQDRTRRRNPRRQPAGSAVAAVSAAVVLAAAGALAAAPPAAAAAAHVTVTPKSADPDYATTLTLSGTGFQSVKGGFGGVYVLFGTVGSKWRPSQGGASGTDYAYVPDAQTRSNHGFQRFVSFPGGSTLSEANGGVVAADGSWHTTLVIPGARFSVAGTNGQARTVDCTHEQCGVITIGAHGVVSPQNETFTPVTFAVPKKQGGAAAPKKSAPPAKPAATTAPAPTTAAPAPTSAAPPAAPTTPAPAAASPDPSTTSVATALHTSSGSGPRVAGIAAAVVVAAGGTAWFLRRRRGARTGG